MPVVEGIIYSHLKQDSGYSEFRCSLHSFVYSAPIFLHLTIYSLITSLKQIIAVVHIFLAFNFVFSLRLLQPILMEKISLADLCEPCPDNGYCSNGQLVCLHGYKKLGRKCIEDGEINQTAKRLVSSTFSILLELLSHLSDALRNSICTLFLCNLIATNAFAKCSQTG